MLISRYVSLGLLVATSLLLSNGDIIYELILFLCTNASTIQIFFKDFKCISMDEFETSKKSCKLYVVNATPLPTF